MQRIPHHSTNVTLKFLTILLALCVANALQAQLPDTPVIFPKPQHMQLTGGHFSLSVSTVIVADEFAKPSVAALNRQLKKEYAFQLQPSKAATKSLIRLSINNTTPRIEGKYELKVQPDGIVIAGSTPSGIFYGVQTLLQLIENTAATSKKVKVKTGVTLSLPCVSISDEPRFAYRGMHLDVCRHFFEVAFVKKYIDYLAAYKFNTFHWHLTDDQGWRIEIKKYPRLTSVGGWRNGTIIGRYPGKGNDGKKYGGFYTQEQIKEIVQYAADRYITVVPEIEMPGHASAAIAAYPQLSCFPNENTQHPPQSAWAGDTTGKQLQQTWGVFDDVFCPSAYTFHFLEDVLDEVIPLFPSKYIHIGGDECPKTAWKRSAFCQDLMREKGLKNEHELQSYFIQTIEKYVNSKGRRIIGWDEILEGGLAPDATVMSWTGEKGGITAAQQNHDVVMTPSEYMYFDHSQTKNEDSVTIGGYLPLETVYNYNPVPAVLDSLQSKHILGAQANLWTEYITNPAKVEYMLFPRLAALSEVSWTNTENKSWDDFEKRLPVLFTRLEKEKVAYSKAFLAPQISVVPSDSSGQIILRATSKDTSLVLILGWKKDYVMEGEKIPEAVGSGNVELKLNHGGLFSIMSLKNGKMLTNESQAFSFNKATGKNITLANPPSKAYPGNGAFTLIDGIQNNRKLERSTEFLGFNGKDCEAVIDLVKTDTISKVIVHCLSQQPSWIYLPKTIEINLSNDGSSYTTHSVYQVPADHPGNNAFTIPIPAATGRFIKLKMVNNGTIADGLPGAGNPAWLFVDEIEVW